MSARQDPARWIAFIVLPAPSGDARSASARQGRRGASASHRICSIP